MTRLADYTVPREFIVQVKFTFNKAELAKGLYVQVSRNAGDVVAATKEKEFVLEFPEVVFGSKVYVSRQELWEREEEWFIARGQYLLVQKDTFLEGMLLKQGDIYKMGIYHEVHLPGGKSKEVRGGLFVDMSDKKVWEMQINLYNVHNQVMCQPKAGEIRDLIKSGSLKDTPAETLE